MFGPFVVCYLFLGGAGAGACLVLAVLGLLVPDAEMRRDPACRKLFVPGFIVALGALALGCVCLALDLGRADRLLLLLMRPAPAMLVVGAYSLVSCFIAGAALLLFWCSGARWRTLVVQILEVLTIIAALLTMLYTGFLLQGMRAVPLWAGAWLPVLFALSALSCGIALLLLSAHFSNALPLFRTVFRRLVAVDAVAIVLEFAAMVLFAATVGTAYGDVGFGEALALGFQPEFATALDGIMGAAEGQLLPDGQPAQGLGALGSIQPESTQTLVAAAASVHTLLSGPDAWVFWFGFVAVGLVAPFAMELILLAAARRGRRFPHVYSACIALLVLAGGLALRLVVVGAGLHPVAMSAAMGIG